MLLKSILEGGLCALPSRVGTGSSLVLAYHNVVDAVEGGRGDASLHIDAGTFAQQLRALKDETDIVSLPELLATIDQPGRRSAITFDDAYHGCVTLGIGQCQNYGIVPTVFVAPGLLGFFPPWDIRANNGNWAAADRESFLREERGVAADYCISSSLPEVYRIATLEELRGLPPDALHFGNHTWSHCNLSRLTVAEVKYEVTRTAAFLEENWPLQALPVLAYPYGIAPAHLTSLNGSGISHALSVSGGWARRGGVSGMLLPRLNVPAGLSMNRFRSRLRGWML